MKLETKKENERIKWSNQKRNDTKRNEATKKILHVGNKKKIGNKK